MGIEGPLRAGMILTMKVLRQSRTILETIIEVLKYDPLHQWSLSPLTIAKLSTKMDMSRAFNPGKLYSFSMTISIDA